MARIMLVDDDDQLRTMLKTVLVSHGYEVIEARNGVEAIEVFPDSRADLLITDILMPGKDGFEVIMRVRDSYPDIKIIAMSGGGQISGRHYTKIAEVFGAQRTLMKPFSPKELLMAIESLLDNSSYKSQAL